MIVRVVRKEMPVPPTGVSEARACPSWRGDGAWRDGVARRCKGRRAGAWPDGARQDGACQMAWRDGSRGTATIGRRDGALTDKAQHKAVLTNPRPVCDERWCQPCLPRHGGGQTTGADAVPTADRHAPTPDGVGGLTQNPTPKHPSIHPLLRRPPIQPPQVFDPPNLRGRGGRRGCVDEGCV